MQKIVLIFLILLFVYYDTLASHEAKNKNTAGVIYNVTWMLFTVAVTIFIAGWW